ncbi:MAG: OprO/OprP family phosphate-selective porin [Syntrophobacteraceae bacterium]
MRKYLAPVMALVFMASFAWTVRAVADQQTLAEKLLIILKQNHQITQEQYNELLQEAQKEKAEQKTAVQKQVKAETAQAAKQYKATHPLAVKASWKHDELFFETNNGNFTMHVGGYAQLDFGGADVNERMKAAFPTLPGYGAEVRRLRLALQGTMYRDFDYNVGIEFGGGSVVLKDAYISYYGFPCIANIRVGHMKEPFSLEELTSSNWFEFTERSLDNSFVTSNVQQDRNMGVMLFNTEFDQRMTWAAGGYMQQDNPSGTSYQSGGFNNANVSGRLTFLPWYADKGCELVHLGFGYRHLFRSDNTADWYSSKTTTLPYAFDFLSVPEFHLSPVKTVNTGSLVAESGDQINPELAVVYGPFSVQGEFFDTFLNDYTTNDKTFTNPDLTGYYVMASWFLTGEHRNYDRKYGVFGRPKLCCNFDPNAGTWGAWELAARYSSIDLNDKGVHGGSEQDWNGSLIWYLNPNLRWMFDYIHAHVDGPVGTTVLQNGDANIFDTRFQIVY